MNKYPHEAIAAVRNKATQTHIEFVCIYCGKKEMLPQSIVNSRGGKKYCSLECRRKAMWGKQGANFGYGKKMEGNKNPNWKGGISKERKGRKSIKEQAKWRRLVYYRDGYICQRCGYDKGKILNAHHIMPWADSQLRRFDVSNGITLCKRCHDWVHSNGNSNNEYICRS